MPDFCDFCQQNIEYSHHDACPVLTGQDSDYDDFEEGYEAGWCRELIFESSSLAFKLGHHVAEQEITNEMLADLDRLSGDKIADSTHVIFRLQFGNWYSIDIDQEFDDNEFFDDDVLEENKLAWRYGV